jgi:NAD(P)-dependent dehydrogenase (short-subunit alcohol dehydrogenase family)
VNGLSDRVALVTGAANGIGLAIARRFVAEGMRVVALDVDGEALEAALREHAPDAVPVVADVSDRAEVPRAVETCLETFGQLDILAANAGIADGQPLLEIDERSWRRILDVNAAGAFFSIQAAARAMVGRGGAIVATSSTNSWFVEANLAHYNASKGAIEALVRTAAFELAPLGIRVNAVAPSMVRTRAAFITHDPVGGPEYLKRVPMGRFAEPEEIAAAVAFLASDEASYITGQTLILDGGLTLGVEMPLPQAPLDQVGLPGSARAEAAP